MLFRSAENLPEVGHIPNKPIGSDAGSLLKGGRGRPQDTEEWEPEPKVAEIQNLAVDRGFGYLALSFPREGGQGAW